MGWLCWLNVVTISLVLVSGRTLSPDGAPGCMPAPERATFFGVQVSDGRSLAIGGHLEITHSRARYIRVHIRVQKPETADWVLRIYDAKDRPLQSIDKLMISGNDFWTERLPLRLCRYSSKLKLLRRTRSLQYRNTLLCLSKPLYRITRKREISRLEVPIFAR
jgi:hypothetical protein